MTARRGRGQLPRGCAGSASGWVLMMLLAAVGGAGVWLLLGPLWQSRAPVELPRRPDSGVQGEDLSVWFASRQQDALVAEKRFIPSGATMIDRAKAALGQLIAGPRTEAQRTLPADVQVRELFVDDLGTAYVDFTEGLRRHHPGGPWAEILTIQSIVQTLTSNVPEIKRVQILIEGREVDSLAGHVDIRGPIAQTWITNRR